MDEEDIIAIKTKVELLLETEKYKNLNEEKFAEIGTQIFKSANGLGSIYQISYSSRP